MENNDKRLLAAIMLAENASKGENAMFMTGSSVMKRMGANRPKEFGTTLKDVIYSQKSPYYGTGNRVFSDAMAVETSNYYPPELHQKSMTLADALLTGQRKPADAMFSSPRMRSNA